MEQKEVPATGHTEVVDPAVAPTYTSTGLTEGSHCSVCGEIIKPQQVIPMLVKEDSNNNSGNTNDNGSDGNSASGNSGSSGSTNANADANTNTSANSGKTAPKTGDTSNVVLWICLLAACMGVITGGILIRKRAR